MDWLMRRASFLLLALLTAAVFLPIVARATPPAGFEIQTIAAGLELPTSLAFAPDGRVFITEKRGAVRVFKNGALLPTPLIQLSNVNDYGDRGLLGIAVDPNFAANGFLYLSYTYENTPGENYEGSKTGRIVRVTVAGDVADESSTTILVGSIGGDKDNPSCDDLVVTDDCIPSDSPSHSVGGLRFGPDGKLYAALGDGAHFDFVDSRALRAQNIDSLSGKYLRINSDGTAPEDNPFFNGDPTSNRSRVWTFGNRNPFRFNFRPDNGTLFSGDVGWSTWEEVNILFPGANYGWPCREGFARNDAYNCDASSTTDPLYAYPHDAGGGGAVVGGDFATAASYPADFHGDYIFGDFAQNFLKQMTLSADDEIISVLDFEPDAGGPVEIVTGPDGLVYYLSIYNGELRRIIFTGANRAPAVNAAANPTSGFSPLSVIFSSAGTIDPDGDPMMFAWDFGDGATSSEPNPQHTYTVDGLYTATLTATDDKGATASDSVMVSVGSQAPDAVITDPLDGSFYETNQIVALAATASDVEDETLPDSAFHWRVILHHNTHIHILQQLVGPNHSFLAPDHESTDIFVEAELTVTDSSGLTDVERVNLFLKPPVPTGSFRAEYFPNITLAGLPALIEDEVVVLHNWGPGGPGDPIPVDFFSARYIGDFPFEAGTYSFFAIADDGVRLFIDDTIVIDQWIDQSATAYEAERPLSSGTHRVRLEFYEHNVDAVAELSWQLSGSLGDFAPVLIQTLVSPDQVSTGDSAHIVTSIQNDGTEGQALVDIEVWQGETKIVQKFYDAESFPTGVTREFDFDWVPTITGEYRIGIGVFKPGWSGLISWTNQAASFLVSSGSTTGPFAPQHALTMVTPGFVEVGEMATLTTTIENSGGAGSAIVDIEVWRGETKIAQEFSELVFAEGETHQFSMEWTAAELGDYRIAIGIFKPGWSELVQWVNEAGAIHVGDASASVPIYNDGLEPGWENWSWGGMIDFASPEQIFSGSAAAKISFSEPWAGLYLHRAEFDTTGKAVLSFVIRASAAGSGAFQIMAFDEATRILTPVRLELYVSPGGFTPDTWILIEVPLADIGAADRLITGVAIQSMSGNVEPSFWVDVMEIH